MVSGTPYPAGNGSGIFCLFPSQYRDTIKSMEKKVLLFGFNDFAGRALASNLKSQLRDKAITVCSIEKKHYMVPLGFLASQAGGEKAAESSVTEIPGMPPVTPYDGSELPVRILLFCGVISEELDQALAVCRSCGIGRDDLKAILTPHNALWNALLLSQELMSEHEQMKRQSR